MKKLIPFIMLLFILNGCLEQSTMLVEITFVSNGGSEVLPIYIEYDSFAVKPDNPTKEGYYFSGWYAEPTFNNPFDFTTPIFDDLTLYAKWDDTLYFYITFVTNHSTTISSVMVEINDLLDEPDELIKESYLFKGWYTNPEFIDLYDFSTPITSDLTLYAKWNKTSTLSLVDSNDNIIVSLEIECGADLSTYDISLPPYQKGYDFDRWDQELPLTMPDEDLTIHGLYFTNTYIQSDDAETGDFFGSNFFIWDHYVFVVPELYNLQADTLYIFDLNDSDYERQIILPKDETTDPQRMVSYVKISDDYIIVSVCSSEAFTGSILIYKFSDTEYERQIIGSGTSQGSSFGKQTQISGDYIITFAYNPSGVYVYKLSDPSYERLILGSESELEEDFNRMIVSGDNIIVQSQYQCALTGGLIFEKCVDALIIYQLSNDSYERVIIDENAIPGDAFGNDVTVVGDYLITNSRFEFYENYVTNQIEYQGAVFVYKLSDNEYERKIVGSQTTGTSRFGSIFAAQNDYLVIESDDQMAYIYHLGDLEFERIIPTDYNDTSPGLIHIEGDYLIMGRQDNDLYIEKINIYSFTDIEYHRVLESRRDNNDTFFSLSFKTYGDYLIINTFEPYDLPHEDRKYLRVTYVYKLSNESYEHVLIYDNPVLFSHDMSWNISSEIHDGNLYVGISGYDLGKGYIVIYDLEELES